MPWGWNVRDEFVETGGSVGTPAEASRTGAWPGYEAEYLKARLGSEYGKFDTGDLGAEQRQVYLDNVARDYKDEAESCLKAEFLEWLQGMHPDNASTDKYDNYGVGPTRLHVYDGEVGTRKDDWVSTPWGGTQLTHLPGVRDYLRSVEERKDRAELELNLLAEHGPQDLEQAWMYFKHWVKRRPVRHDICARKDYTDQIGVRSNFGWQQPNAAEASSEGDEYEEGEEYEAASEPAAARPNPMRRTRSIMPEGYVSSPAVTRQAASSLQAAASTLQGMSASPGYEGVAYPEYAGATPQSTPTSRGGALASAGRSMYGEVTTLARETAKEAADTLAGLSRRAFSSRSRVLPLQ